MWKDYTEEMVEAEAGPSEGEKPLLKHHTKGGEVQEPGPGIWEMDQNQETGQSEAQLSKCQKVKYEAESAGRWLICG